MEKNINALVSAYQRGMNQGDIQVAYEYLIKFVLQLKTYCGKAFPDGFSVGAVSPGYMDFTYFPFSNDDLKRDLLRFGIVLNHREMQFELWLMGQNSDVQKRYWDVLKASVWNRGRSEMPRYAVLETVLVAQPNFEDAGALCAEIAARAIGISAEIQDYLRSVFR